MGILHFRNFIEKLNILEYESPKERDDDDEGSAKPEKSEETRGMTSKELKTAMHKYHQANSHVHEKTEEYVNTKVTEVVKRERLKTELEGLVRKVLAAKYEFKRLLQLEDFDSLIF